MTGAEDRRHPLPIVTGYPLDLLLNRKCQLSDYDKWRINPIEELPADKTGGLVIPDADGDLPGTGNIVIRGKPGSGKSTLALQLACAVTYSPNNASAIYLSLEESQQNIREKAKTFGWGGHVFPISRFYDTGNGSAPDVDTVCKSLGEILEKNGNKVLVPSMSPRSVFVPDRPVHDLFWDRYRQLEIVLSAARKLNEKWEEDINIKQHIRVVCVDSLSVFGDLPLTREELYKIFDLFRRYHMIGVFTAEESDRNTNGGNQDVDYLADMVIHLHSEEDSGYAMKYIEVTKSRYQNELHGRHPFKIRIPALSNPDQGSVESPKSVLDEKFAALKIYLSLHHVVLATGDVGPEQQKRRKRPGYFDIGVQGLEELLPPKFPKQSVVTLKGPRGAFKTQIARSFLMSGILKRRKKSEFCGKSNEDNHVLLINLHGVPIIAGSKPDASDKWLLDKSFIKERSKRIDRTSKLISGAGTTLGEWTLSPDPDNETSANRQGMRSKYSVATYVWKGKQGIYTTGVYTTKKITELTFRSGALLPEEFIEEVRQVMNRFKNTSSEKEIRRVVLDDVSLIGTSYPFLRNSKTSADLFLPAFVHVMRNYHVDLLMTACTGELQEVQDVVDRAVGLSDTVLDVQFCDVFGKQHVIVLGDGLTAQGSGQSPNKEKELVPGTVRMHDDYFEVVPDMLRGLVGFSSGRVHRPGLTVYVPEQGPLLKKYNREIEHMLASTFGYSLQDRRSSPTNRQGIASVQRFNNTMAETVHDSMRITDQPLDQTVVCAVDEFGHGSDGQQRFCQLDKCDIEFEKGFEAERNICMRPYYGNVLLLAYRPSLLKKEISAENLKWSTLLEAIEGFSLSGDCDYSLYYEDASGETLACALIDALLCQTAIELKQLDGETQLAAKLFKNLIREIEESRTQDEAEVYSLYRLLRRRSEEEQLARSKQSIVRRQPEIRRMSRLSPPQSIFYLCWYSQLREWMSMDKRGKLARELKVLPLPGRGFRGDWYLSVVKGSVSKSLGEELIDNLCSAKEDYKRFARGIGLPTRNYFYEPAKPAPDGSITPPPGDFYSWPNSNADKSSTLEDKGGYLLEDFYKNIYKSARHRSHIQDYQKVRPILWTICRQLEARRNAGPDDIWNVLKRVPRQIELLSKK